MTETSVNSPNDVVQLLIAQHNEIKRLLAETLRAPDGTEREKAFFELRRLLAVHETAEELVVHPLARRKSDTGDALVDAALREEHQTKEQLAKLESMGTDAAEFDTALAELHSALLVHAEHEENDEFRKLHQQLGADQLKVLAAAVRAAERMAPTRPHPGVESATANIAAGPFAAMLDRARDALKRAIADNLPRGVGESFSA